MSEFKPYFVVYRLVFPDGSKPLFIESFETLYSLYDYIFNNKDSWSFYSVGRCLELFINDKV